MRVAEVGKLGALVGDYFDSALFFLTNISN